MNAILRAALAHLVTSTVNDLIADGWVVVRTERARLALREAVLSTASVEGVRRACAEVMRERSFDAFNIGGDLHDFPAGYDL